MSIRGPGISKNSIVTDLVINIDLAPTIVDMAGLNSADEKFDGLSFLSLLGDAESDAPIQSRDSFLVEYHGEGDCARNFPDECRGIADEHMCFCTVQYQCKCQDSGNNTYSCVRKMTAEENSIYCMFQDNENFVELYDLYEDPYQLENRVLVTPKEKLDAYKHELQDFKHRNDHGWLSYLLHKIKIFTV